MVRAYVLAGGLGTRLQGRIGDLPKALAPFAGRPFLDAQLEWLAAAGVDEVVLALGVGAAAVIEHLRARPASALPRVAWSVEPAPLGTGGALARAARDEGGDFLVVNGDTLAEVDFAALRARHAAAGAAVTLACFRVDDVAARGRVEMDAEGRVSAFREKSGGGEAWASGGVGACAPAVLAAIPADRPVSLEAEVFPALLAAGRPVRALRCPGHFYDIGTPEGLARAEREWRPGAGRGQEGP